MFDQNYLEDLIHKKLEESQYLEYKASGALINNDRNKKEISKDISSFANADGGMIIYGISEENHLPIAIDPINRTNTTKEWLDHVIQSIRPILKGIIIHPVEINNDSDLVVYVVEIPKGETAHQAIDKKYYRRHNFNSIPMYDYEIRDVMNRLKRPNVHMYFEIHVNSFYSKASTHPLSGQKVESTSKTYNILKAFVHNKGKVFAKYINCDLRVPESILNTDKFNFIDKGQMREFMLENTFRDVIDVDVKLTSAVKKLGPTRFHPLLPSRVLELEFELELPEFYTDHNEKEIFWSVYADNSEEINGFVKIGEIKILRNTIYN